MDYHDIIVIGASAGGVQAVTEVCRGLPPDLPAAVFVVVHTSPRSPGILPQLLARAGPLPAEMAQRSQPIRHGRIYVAPPDHHLLIKRGRAILAKGPRENGFRPAVDPLFRTAARAYGSRVVGVILSGGLDDGTEGLSVIKRCGGVAIVQDPEEAPFPSMPRSAMQEVKVDHVLGVGQMSAVLAELARELAGLNPIPSVDDDRDRAYQDVAESGDAGLKVRDLPVAPSGFTCPECGGAVWEIKDGRLVKYRCHVGHSYTPEGLMAAQSEALESALWTALRALEETAAMRRRMAKRSRNSEWETLAREYEQQAAVAQERAAVIRKVLLSDRKGGDHVTLPEPPPTPTPTGRRERRTENGNGNGNGNGTAPPSKVRDTKGNGSSRKAKVIRRAIGAAKGNRTLTRHAAATGLVPAPGPQPDADLKRARRSQRQQRERGKAKTKR